MLKIINRVDVGQYIGTAKKILDVGSGQKPLPVATCTVDKLPSTYVHKGRLHTENPAGKIKKIKNIPFIEAELPNLPFQDHEFDFVYCSHVIEHVEDVAAGLKELARIAPRGYLECPRSWFEYVDCTPFHKWYIDFDGTSLVLKRKTEEEMAWCLDRRIVDKSSLLFNRMYRTYDANSISGVHKIRKSHQLRDKVRRFLRSNKYPSREQQIKNKSFTTICLYWENEIPFKILNPSVYG
jgi:ubiquinone/menaquinone biosynthesis C-methylase UbiE